MSLITKLIMIHVYLSLSLSLSLTELIMIHVYLCVRARACVRACVCTGYVCVHRMCVCVCVCDPRLRARDLYHTAHPHSASASYIWLGLFRVFHQPCLGSFLNGGGREVCGVSRKLACQTLNPKERSGLQPDLSLSLSLSFSLSLSLFLSIHPSIHLAQGPTSASGRDGTEGARQGHRVGGGF